MNLLLKTFVVLLAIFAAALFFIGCAVIIPPGGGPKDTIPPQLVSSTPRDSSTNFSGKKIELVFDEYVQVENVQQNLIVSPLVKTMPNVSAYLHRVTIQFKDTLEANTTYSFDFGPAIKDANEGNPFGNYVFAVSTGATLDTESLSGKVTLAETGGADSTLLAVLYDDLSDTAVYKTQPRYYTRIDTAGNFTFNFLPTGKQFNLFVVPNTFMKNYADSTQLFAFYEPAITTGAADSTGIHLYAYREVKATERPRILSENQIKKLKEEEAKKELEVTVSAKNSLQSLIQDLTITYNKPLKNFNANGILLADTNYRRVPDYTVEKNNIDSNNTVFDIKTSWIEKNDYVLIIRPEAAIDSFDLRLAKGDTTRFTTKANIDYASFTMTFPDVDISLNPVVQLLQNNKVVDSLAINPERKIIREVYEPGDYQLRILYDKNKNMQWDPGNYHQHLQPEIVVPHKRTISLRANWENELEIFINQ